MCNKNYYPKISEVKSPPHSITIRVGNEHGGKVQYERKLWPCATVDNQYSILSIHIPLIEIKIL